MKRLSYLLLLPILSILLCFSLNCKAEQSVTKQDNINIEDIAVHWQSQADSYLDFLKDETFQQGAIRIFMKSEMLSALGETPTYSPYDTEYIRILCKTRRLCKLIEHVNRAKSNGEIGNTAKELNEIVELFMKEEAEVEDKLEKLAIEEPEIFQPGAPEKERSRFIDLARGYALNMSLDGAAHGLAANSFLMGLTESPLVISSLLKIAAYDDIEFQKHYKAAIDSDNYVYEIVYPNSLANFPVIADALDRILVSCANQQQSDLTPSAKTVAAEYVKWRSEQDFPEREVIEVYPWDGSHSPYSFPGSVTGKVDEVEKMQIMLPIPLAERIGSIFFERGTNPVMEEILDWAQRFQAALDENVQHVEAVEKVPVHPWHSERVENIRSETIEQLIENIANFDDLMFAETSLSSGVAFNEMESQVKYIINLFRLRRLLQEGRSNPQQVTQLLRNAYRQDHESWPEVRAERLKLFMDNEGRLPLTAPDEFQIIHTRVGAATYLLSELHDHDALPLLVEGYKKQCRWFDEYGFGPVSSMPIPKPITLYAIHRLAVTLPESKMDSTALAARNAYMHWAEQYVPEPEILTVAAWYADYDESDPFLHMVDPKDEVLVGQPTLELARYPYELLDGTYFLIGESEEEKQREKEWADLLIPFVEAAYKQEP